LEQVLFHLREELAAHGKAGQFERLKDLIAVISE
jgi:hypothetical protein